MPHISDEELIQRIKAGDTQAFKDIFNRYKDKIVSYLYRYMGDYQKAEDSMIETFLDVYKRLPQYQEEGKFLPWVYRIATNFAKKEFRKRKRARELSLDEKVDMQGMAASDGYIDNTLRPDSSLMRKELSELIEKAILKLDGKYRNVLLLCDVQGMSYEEAAYALKWRPLTVGTTLSRARKMLYLTMKRMGYDR